MMCYYLNVQFQGQRVKSIHWRQWATSYACLYYTQRTRSALPNVQKLALCCYTRTYVACSNRYVTTIETVRLWKYKVVQIWPGLICVQTSRTVQQLRDLERVKPQPPPSLLLGLEPVQSCLGVAKVMSNYGYKKKKNSSGHIWTTLYICFQLDQFLISVSQYLRRHNHLAL